MKIDLELNSDQAAQLVKMYEEGELDHIGVRNLSISLLEKPARDVDLGDMLSGLVERARRELKKKKDITGGTSREQPEKSKDDPKKT